MFPFWAFLHFWFQVKVISFLMMRYPFFFFLGFRMILLDIPLQAIFFVWRGGWHSYPARVIAVMHQ